MSLQLKKDAQKKGNKKPSMATPACRTPRCALSQETAEESVVEINFVQQLAAFGWTQPPTPSPHLLARTGAFKLESSTDNVEGILAVRNTARPSSDHPCWKVRWFSQSSQRTTFKKQTNWLVYELRKLKYVQVLQKLDGLPGQSVPMFRCNLGFCRTDGTLFS